jgi:GT2 family glycosyltransferase/SAM-dependent methyltransferase
MKKLLVSDTLNALLSPSIIIKALRILLQQGPRGLFTGMVSRLKLRNQRELDLLPKKSTEPPCIFPESVLARKYCVGKGLEIGGAAHNPFGLNTLNVDFTDSMETAFKKEEVRLCGRALKVDIIACGDNIPLPDGSQDFVVSSHVLEHFPNPIKALLEWDRLVRPGGIIFMIIPHKERTFDKHKARTSLQHLVEDFISNNRALHNDSPGHDHCWITEDILDLVNWMIDTLHMKWEIAEVQDVDDKVGNGFTIVIRKKESSVSEKKDVYVGDIKGDVLRDRDALITNFQSVIRGYKLRLEQQIITTHKLESLVKEKEEALNHIYSSRGWKVLTAYYGARDRVLPVMRKVRPLVSDILNALLYALLSPSTIIKALRILLQQGRSALFTQIVIKLKLRNQYKLYLLANQLLEDSDDKKADKAKAFRYRPKVSILVPVYDTNEKWLRLCIESLLSQVYGNWELCIADGRSTKPHIRKVLEEYAKRDNRIKVNFLPENKGIAGNSNEALALATGEFVGFLDHDDELSSSALYEVVKLLNENSDADFIYSDEDKISTKGKRFDPHFKPAWSPDTLRSCNYITHFTVLRKKIIDEVGGFREGYAGSQDYDLFLRVAERTQRIVHIPKVLYSWRVHKSSASGNPRAKMYAYESAKKALRDHIRRIGLNGEVYNTPSYGIFRIKYQINDSPKVSIIIPTKDRVNVLKRCISSILYRTSYRNYGIFIVDHQSREKETLGYYKELKGEPRIEILRYGSETNFSGINSYAVSQIDSEYITFLDNDTEVISPDWIEAMLEFAQRKDVGAVGALLYYPNDTIQHAGVIVGIRGFAGHSHKHFRRNAFGYMGRAKLVQNLSAVTAACLMTRKSVFEQVGGFDERLAFALNDIDLCLKLREEGYLVVWTPYAELYHHESIKRGHEDIPEEQEKFRREIEYFRSNWKPVLEKGDPYYNPNLTLDKEDFSIRI